MRAWGYTEAQHVALGALARALRRARPGVDATIPTDPEGQVLMGTLPAPETCSGFLGHWPWLLRARPGPQP